MCYSKNEFITMLEFLMITCCRVQIAYLPSNIPMYANHALLFADLVIYAYGAKCFKTKTRTEAKAFDLTFKYIDDVL